MALAICLQCAAVQRSCSLLGCSNRASIEIVADHWDPRSLLHLGCICCDLHMILALTVRAGGPEADAFCGGMCCAHCMHHGAPGTLSYTCGADVISDVAESDSRVVVVCWPLCVKHVSFRHARRLAARCLLACLSCAQAWRLSSVRQNLQRLYVREELGTLGSVSLVLML